MTSRFTLFAFVLLFILSLGLTAQAQNVSVTFRFNSCTNLDTLTATNGFVELRGQLNDPNKKYFPGGDSISWDDKSTLEMVNVGGDYWELTVEMEPADTLYYKFWTGYSPSVGTFPNGGWEGGFSPSNGLTWDTRTFISGTTDTVLDVQYYHPSTKGTVDQYLKPFVSKTDSVAVYFRVNIGGEMEAERFDPAVNGPVGIRGDNTTSGQVLSWDVTNILLTWEAGSIYKTGSFWSGVAYIPKDSIDLEKQQSFKFYAENTSDFSWEDGSDHKFYYPSDLKDTTIAWTWFSNKPITGVAPVTSIITWRVSTEALEAIGMFDRGENDKISVRGPRGWDVDVELFYNPLLREWDSANEEFKLPPGTEIFYKYYVNWDSSRADTASPNYIKGIRLDDNGWEEPGSTGGGNRIHVFQDAAEQTVVGDFGFDRQFFNSVPANGVYDSPITVTWNVDMTNAANADSNTLGDLFRPGIDSVWVLWDGELLGITQGHDMWYAATPAPARDSRFLLLSDDNTDMIYTGSYTITPSEKYPNGWYQLGYKVAYSTADGSLIIHGSGVDRGRRYLQYIHPVEINPGTPWPVPVWPSTFDLPVVSWRRENLFTEYPPPDLTKATTGLADRDKVANTYKLEQNYPNPFNPSTTIKYSLAKAGDVKIKVYNVTGQLVTTLLSKWQSAGYHITLWNGKNSNGDNVGSGIYFIKLVSGDFSSVKKMTLIR